MSNDQHQNAQDEWQKRIDQINEMKSEIAKQQGSWAINPGNATMSGILKELNNLNRGMNVLLRGLGTRFEFATDGVEFDKRMKAITSAVAEAQTFVTELLERNGGERRRSKRKTRKKDSSQKAKQPEKDAEMAPA